MDDNALGLAFAFWAFVWVVVVGLFMLGIMFFMVWLDNFLTKRKTRHNSKGIGTDGVRKVSRMGDKLPRR